MIKCKICGEETSNSYGVCDACKDILIRMKLKNEIWGRKNMKTDKGEEKSNLELQKEIKQLKKRIRDLERERDILLALHRMDLEDM